MKIGDNWGLKTAATLTSSRHDGLPHDDKPKNGGVTGYILRKSNNSRKNQKKTEWRKVPSVKGDKKTRVTPPRSGARMSFDGESSFVDFEHESVYASHEPSAESRNVLGECMLTIPEDRLKLLGSGNNGLVSELPSSKLPPVASIDENIVAAATAAACATAADGLFQETVETTEAVMLPVVVNCQVTKIDNGNEHEMEINATYSQLPTPPQMQPLPKPPSVHDNILEGVNEDHQIHPSQSVKTSRSPSTSSSNGVSPPVSSVIYETLLINPPLTLSSNKNIHRAASSHEATQNDNNNSNISNHRIGQLSSQRQPLAHRRFQMPPECRKRDTSMENRQQQQRQQQQQQTTKPLPNDGKNESKTNNSNKSNEATSPSKDSISSASGVIKLDIISAF